jgi:CDP-diacylglycerol---glycerol-3-phosphate 3-phosphatidyltransferase
MIHLAFWLFLIAALSDILDGYLARRYHQITAFGRILDPFADKILVIGSFVLLLGDGFRDGGRATVTDLKGWMVVVIVARELLVSGLRGFSEAKGKAFGANWWGKIKMLLQSICVCWILQSLGYWSDWKAFVDARVIVIYVMVLFTAISAVSYVFASREALLEQSSE